MSAKRLWNARFRNAFVRVVKATRATTWLNEVHLRKRRLWTPPITRQAPAIHFLENRSTMLPAGMPSTTLTTPETSITVPHCCTLRPMTSLALTIQNPLTRDAKNTPVETRRERVQSSLGTSSRTPKTLL